MQTNFSSSDDTLCCALSEISVYGVTLIFFCKAANTTKTFHLQSFVFYIIVLDTAEEQHFYATGNRVTALVAYKVGPSAFTFTKLQSLPVTF